MTLDKPIKRIAIVGTGALDRHSASVVARTSAGEVHQPCPATFKEYNGERPKKSLGWLKPGIREGDYKVDLQAREALGAATSPLAQRGSWIQGVIGLLDTAIQQLESSQEATQAAIEQATVLLRAQMPSRSKERARPGAGLLAWQVHKVRAYVDAHMARRVLLSELSGIVQLSEAHFSRSFKQRLGLSPHAFVLRRRLELAARLMLKSSESLADIAQQCGFTDQAHLCRQFKRVMGASPAAWRRARRCLPVGLSTFEIAPASPPAQMTTHV